MTTCSIDDGHLQSLCRNASPEFRWQTRPCNNFDILQVYRNLTRRRKRIRSPQQMTTTAKLNDARPISRAFKSTVQCPCSFDDEEAPLLRAGWTGHAR